MFDSSATGKKPSVISKATELSSIKETKFAKIFFEQQCCRAAFRKSKTNWTNKTEIQFFFDLINLDKRQFWLTQFFSASWILANIAS